MTENQTEPQEVHMNILQLLYMLVKAALTVVLIGRGGGKSKIGAQFLKDCCEKMPRSVVRFGTYTYEGMFLNVLPGIIKSWEQDHKYIEGIHFWVGQWPPEEFMIPKPYFRPQGNPKHIISWWTGAVIILTSMDRVINNGSDFDAGLFDEVRLYPQSKVTELLRAKRGNQDHFGELSEHGSIMFMTDRPWTQDGAWILNYKDLQNQDFIDAIMAATKRIEDLYTELDEIHNRFEEKEALNFEPDKDDLVRIDEIRDLIRETDFYRNELRKVTTQFIEGSTFENVHALGLNYLLDTRRDSTEFEWNTSILNLPVGKVEDGFYALLNNEIHGYNAADYDYIDSLEHTHKTNQKPTWRFYADYDRSAPLHIACDHNNAINWILTGQPFEGAGQCRFQNAMYVTSPDYIRQLIEQWDAFYKDYPCRKVVYHYNHTHIAANSKGDKSEAEVVIETLTALGWIVETNYIGQASRHHSMYLLWQESLGESDKQILRPVFNLSTCKTLLAGMGLTPVKITEGEFRKDKSSERKDYKSQKYKVPPPLATHGSEAADLLLTGFNRHKFKSNEQYTDTMSA